MRPKKTEAVGGASPGINLSPQAFLQSLLSEAAAGAYASPGADTSKAKATQGQGWALDAGGCPRDTIAQVA